ncbi:MAG: 3-phosphoshikimate 1-carboxyvinyltransferase [Candidatus Eremiobacteraeota bacterium]|nr:3-phosphoshikimate 1-carboxyvinyltransferase [Candidatus Eremiobacteraeota bacterium]
MQSEKVRPDEHAELSEVIFERGAIRGRITVPGDKSISHRALLIAAKSSERTTILNLNPGLDVAATSIALRAIGTQITGDTQRTDLRGGDLHSPGMTVDCMNSGSTARMFMGVCAGAALKAQLNGDVSLRRRPIEPVAAQLRAFGARIETSQGKLPATIRGCARVQSRRFILIEPSAQVKSALLLAGLFAEKSITVTADQGSRDHTERMLQFLGADIRFDRQAVHYEPGPIFSRTLHIPGDFSAAAFFIVAAAIAPHSELLIEDVGLNPTRTGLLDALRQMGADIVIGQESNRCGEPIGNVTVRSSPLRAISIGPELALRAIDEILALAVACACAQGTSTISGIRVLRSKESDRIDAIGRILQAVGVEVQTARNGITIHGGKPSATDRIVKSHEDHRTVMAVATLACAAGPLRIDDASPVATSFPDFIATLGRAQSVR